MEQDLLVVRHFLVSALACAFREPIRAGDAHELVSESSVKDAWDALQTAWSRIGGERELGLGELDPGSVDITPLARWLLTVRDRRQRAFVEVFGLVVSRSSPPYEAEYCPSSDPTRRVHMIADAAGFYAAFGLRPHSDRPERADHVSLILDFVGVLLERRIRADLGGHDDVESARAIPVFLADHVTWWIPTFARALENTCIRAFGRCDESETADALHALAGLASVLRAWVAFERCAAGVAPSREIVEPLVSLEQVGADSVCLACPESCGAPE